MTPRAVVAISSDSRRSEKRHVTKGCHSCRSAIAPSWPDPDPVILERLPIEPDASRFGGLHAMAVLRNRLPRPSGLEPASMANDDLAAQPRKRHARNRAERQRLNRIHNPAEAPPFHFPRRGFWCSKPYSATRSEPCPQGDSEDGQIHLKRPISKPIYGRI